MAYPSYGVNDAMAVKHWSKILSVAARDTTPIAPLMGDDENSVIQVKTETKNKGDKVTFALLARLAATGFSEGEVAIGNAEAMTLFSDGVLINEIGTTCSPPSQDSMDAQRIPFNLRDEAKGLLGLWFGQKWAMWFFNQVCGNTAETNAKNYGFNAPTAPSTGRKILAGGVATDDLLTSSNQFTLDLIDKAVEKAVIGTPMLRPLRINGEDMYVVYLHPYQVTSLRTNTSTGQWMDMQRAAMMGGQISKNPIFTNALGQFHNVILRKSQDIPLGVNASNVAVANTRRAVLLGAQAAVCGFGTGKGPTKYRWSEELIDHSRKLEIGGWTFAGLKKTLFNSADFGTVVISTYAAAS